MSVFALTAQHALVRSAARLPGQSGAKRTSAVRTRRAVRFTTAVRASSDSGCCGNEADENNNNNNDESQHALSMDRTRRSRRLRLSTSCRRRRGAAIAATTLAEEGHRGRRRRGHRLALSVADLAAPVLSSHAHGSSQHLGGFAGPNSTIARGRARPLLPKSITASIPTPVLVAAGGRRGHGRQGYLDKPSRAGRGACQGKVDTS